MTFSAIALADLPAAVVGAKAKPITAEDQATAILIAGIVAGGNAAQSGDAFASRDKAETAGRKFAAMLNKALPALPDAKVYRFRILPSGTKVTVPAVAAVAAVPAHDDVAAVEAVAAVPAHSVDGFTFAIVTGNPPKVRGPRTPKVDAAAE